MEFLKSTRIGDDEGGLTQDNMFNKSYNDYMLENHYISNCNMRQPIEFATSQVNVNYCAAGGSGNQCDLGGCNIDQNTYLKTDTILSHPKCKILLEQRPFITVPYLGRGYVDSNIESKIMQGEYNYNRKTSNHIMEQSYIPYSNTLLLENIKS